MIFVLSNPSPPKNMQLCLLHYDSLHAWSQLPLRDQHDNDSDKDCNVLYLKALRTPTRFLNKHNAIPNVHAFTSSTGNWEKNVLLNNK